MTDHFFEDALDSGGFKIDRPRPAGLLTDPKDDPVPGPEPRRVLPVPRAGRHNIERMDLGLTPTELEAQHGVRLDLHDVADVVEDRAALVNAPGTATGAPRSLFNLQEADTAFAKRKEKPLDTADGGEPPAPTPGNSQSQTLDLNLSDRSAMETPPPAPAPGTNTARSTERNKVGFAKGPRPSQSGIGDIGSFFSGPLFDTKSNHSKAFGSPLRSGKRSTKAPETMPRTAPPFANSFRSAQDKGKSARTTKLVDVLYADGSANPRPVLHLPEDHWSLHFRTVDGDPKKKIPIINLHAGRRASILQDTPAIFSLKRKRLTIVGYPGYHNKKFGVTAVRKNDWLIVQEAKGFGVDPDLVRAIMYIENAHGALYGAAAEAFGVAKSLLPMNIRPDLWSGQIGGNPDFGKRRTNVRAGVILIKRIAERTAEPTVEKIAALYNALALEDLGRSERPYFAWVARAYKEKPWL